MENVFFVTNMKILTSLSFLMVGQINEGLFEAAPLASRDLFLTFYREKSISKYLTDEHIIKTTVKSNFFNSPIYLVPTRFRSVICRHLT